MNQHFVQLRRTKFKGAQELCTVEYPVAGVKGTLTYFDFNDEVMLGVIGPDGAQIFNPASSHHHMGDTLIKWMECGDLDVFTKLKLVTKQRRGRVQLNAVDDTKPRQRIKRNKQGNDDVNQTSKRTRVKRTTECSSVETGIQRPSRRVRSKLDQEEPLASKSTVARKRRR